MIDFFKTLDKLSRVNQRFPSKAAVIAVNFSKERFVKKDWVDRSRVSWKKRKRKGRGSTLVRSGRLKRSIRKLRVTSSYIVIGTDVPYAQIHNEGGDIKKSVRVRAHGRRISRGTRGGQSKVKSHTRKMNLKIPKRQFIGESAVLARRIERMLERDIKNALR
ncbi:phage virion morphogenesis family protein [Kordia sp. SMS9]|uniref:phage virion morphogenesis protein n=1 Tax=Kordia sp. SMS9 TaxID=2282170 RepID=UPI000E0DDF4A|nr:phage virion morphogenesis protein [Kordia sp. SMS9]AXG70446.1 phage virion morphogenesis family protein [Kordia sp. SMS9]